MKFGKLTEIVQLKASLFYDGNETNPGERHVPTLRTKAVL